MPFSLQPPVPPQPSIPPLPNIPPQPSRPSLPPQPLIQPSVTPLPQQPLIMTQQPLIMTQQPLIITQQPTAVVPQPVMQPMSSNWVVSLEDKAKADALFQLTDADKDGFVSGFEIKDVFLQSGVPQAVLAHIW